MRFRGVALALFASGACACSEPEPPGSPEQAQLVGEDVVRFWQAYDDGQATGQLEEALESGYRAPGTQQLASFFQLRIGGTADLAGTVARNHGYYESAREQMLVLAAGGPFWDAAQVAFAELERIEPMAVFPPVVLAVGRMSSGGLTSNSGILVGVELFTRQEDSPLDTLTPAEAASARNIQHLLPFVLHQLTHIQQLRLGGLRSTDGRTLLERALFEGIAELVTEEIAGQVVAVDAIGYGEMHEVELWTEFQAVMNGTDVAGWLYEGGSDTERPGDLGYFVGMRIAHAWIANVRGTEPGGLELGIRDLLRASDAQTVLQASGYAP